MLGALERTIPRRRFESVRRTHEPKVDEPSLCVRSRARTGPCLLLASRTGRFKLQLNAIARCGTR